MAPKAQLPVLPQGSSSLFSGLSETFSFHASPEAFITSRVLAFQSSNPTLTESRTPIRAKVLNRNVAVLSSYHHVRQVLSESSDDNCPFSAAKAYDELMAPFFQPSNLLLSDPPSHGPMRQLWDARMHDIIMSSRARCQQMVQAHFREIESGSSVDLYESMKVLAWDVLLTTFLTDSTPSSRKGEREDFRKVEQLQEVLLRGQFSLFPVSVNARLWRSPRSKGLQARKELELLFQDRMRTAPNGCPFPPTSVGWEADVASHLLLFTSSLAVKALASLLTAFLLNLYVYRGRHAGETTLANKLVAMTSASDRQELLRSVCLETERLSPPVVGIMRRATRDVVLQPSHGSTNEQSSLIPGGWDVWLYFVGASRDPAAFGPYEQAFVPKRYTRSCSSHTEVKQGFAFGAGSKSCLGKELMREVAMTVVETCLGTLPRDDSREKWTLVAKAEDIPLGVQGWLGWQSDIKPEQWAKDMKQLPTQRPVKAINVQVICHKLRVPSLDETETGWFDAQEYLEEEDFHHSGLAAGLKG